MTDLSAAVKTLSARVAILDAEAAVRRVEARCMFLCDTPCPEFGVEDDAERIDRIMELFAPEAVWEGVGEHHDGRLGKAEGRDAVKRAGTR